LVSHILSLLPGEKPVMSPETIDQLKAYAWPGNVRELRNVIERAALLAEPPEPRPPTPPPDTLGAVDIEQPFKELKNQLVSTFERAYVKQLIQATNGNVAAAARKARIDRMYLYKLLDRYQLK
jgi:DNA-binding NtrC family response regulator